MRDQHGGRAREVAGDRQQRAALYRRRAQIGNAGRGPPARREQPTAHPRVAVARRNIFDPRPSLRRRTRIERGIHRANVDVRGRGEPPARLRWAAQPGRPLVAIDPDHGDPPAACHGLGPHLDHIPEVAILVLVLPRHQPPTACCDRTVTAVRRHQSGRHDKHSGNGLPRSRLARNYLPPELSCAGPLRQRPTRQWASCSLHHPSPGDGPGRTPGGQAERSVPRTGLRALSRSPRRARARHARPRASEHIERDAGHSRRASASLVRALQGSSVRSRLVVVAARAPRPHVTGTTPFLTLRRRGPSGDARPPGRSGTAQFPISGRPLTARVTA